MQELKVIGVESGALVVMSDDGDRFRIEIDDVLQSRIKQHQHEKNASGPRVSPREIQGHIRAGMSAEDVATVTGADLDYVERFEGPVLAERQHMITSALAVPVHAGAPGEQADDASTFGGVIRERLTALNSSDERWASWKEPSGGWVVKLAFTADSIDHDARWSFEPKKMTLTPLNGEAVTLSQQGESRGALIPRLRAVSADPDTSRFDSGAFTFGELSPDTVVDDADAEPIPYGRTAPVSPPAQPKTSSPAVTRAAIKRADESSPALSETANLMEALRRRRGEREGSAAPSPAAPVPVSASDTPVSEATTPRLVDVPLSTFDEELDDRSGTPSDAAAEKPAQPSSIWSQSSVAGAKQGATRKGRASMPSWDEIVFGARTDDDLA